MIKRTALCLLFIAGFMLCSPIFAGQKQMPLSAFDFSFSSIDGTPLQLEGFKGQPILVVNTASRCGFTPQYTALQNLWTDYREKGLVVIGVPSGDFGGQELASEAEVKQFCEVNFDIDFPMTAITPVKGPQAHEFYKWAGQQVGPLGKPKWNFHKYLIGRDGQVREWFSSVTAPDSKKLRQAVETALAETI